MFKMPAMLLPPGRRLLVGVLSVAALLLALPSAATPVSKIVIFGSHGGSTLRLHPRGHNKLVVKGNLPRRLRGCHFPRAHRKAVCSLRGVGAIEVKMGPKGDLVKVTKRLPLP